MGDCDSRCHEHGCANTSSRPCVQLWGGSSQTWQCWMPLSSLAKLHSRPLRSSERFACKRPSTVGSQFFTSSQLGQPHLATHRASVSSSVKQRRGERCQWPSFGAALISGFRGSPGCAELDRPAVEVPLTPGTPACLSAHPAGCSGCSERPILPGPEGPGTPGRPTPTPSTGPGPELGQDPETEALTQADSICSPSDALTGTGWPGLLGPLALRSHKHKSHGSWPYRGPQRHTAR